MNISVCYRSLFLYEHIMSARRVCIFGSGDAKARFSSCCRFDLSGCWLPGFHDADNFGLRGRVALYMYASCEIQPPRPCLADNRRCLLFPIRSCAPSHRPHICAWRPLLPVASQLGRFIEVDVRKNKKAMQHILQVVKEMTHFFNRNQRLTGTRKHKALAHASYLQFRGD